MAANLEKLVEALSLDAAGEIALRRVMEENNIRDNDPDVMAALAIARVHQTLRENRAHEKLLLKLADVVDRNNKVLDQHRGVVENMSAHIKHLDQRIKSLEQELKNG